ncbi:hypothetical protein P7F88_25485 [Vibrio hannami]|uniref:hypothetical protein n=1 Tax=Vibrio hannami TaxID=2717094 RepID=UPI00240FD39E|nr:hypothetical protein [Vibrio hannami]MDG3089219.1 hypothetical protein [Vibrio hannami]
MNERKVMDQMLNAYRQLQMLSHVMGVPEKAMGLEIDGKGINLAFVSKRRLSGALGMFSYGGTDRTITISDMSNSFAHEWGRALDNYLSQQVADGEATGMLSVDMTDGKVAPPKSPKGDLVEAFTHVIWAMYGNQTPLGEMILRLEQQAAIAGPDGKPTPKAKKAQKALDAVKQGKQPPKEYWSKVFQEFKGLR